MAAYRGIASPLTVIHAANREATVSTSGSIPAVRPLLQR
jgi:hypothetical protein